MRLKAMLANMSSAAICLACFPPGESKTNLFAFPGGSEEFAIHALLWSRVSFAATLATTFASTLATTCWVVFHFLLSPFCNPFLVNALWLTRNAQLGMRSCGTSGGEESESRPAYMLVPVLVVVRGVHEHVAPRWRVALFF